MAGLSASGLPTPLSFLAYKFLGEKKDIQKIATRAGIDEVVRIKWGTLRKGSRVSYGGKSWDMKDFLTKRTLITGERMFTGTDGISYTWQGAQTLQISQDGVVTEVARFRSPFMGLSLMGSHQLGIAQEGLHMMDLIVASWAYVSTLDERDSYLMKYGTAACSSYMLSLPSH